MTDDQIKLLPLAERLIISKMKDYKWEYEMTGRLFRLFHSGRGMTFRKRGWYSSIEPLGNNAGYKAIFDGEKEKIEKTIEAVCLRIELRYRKKMLLAGKGA